MIDFIWFLSSIFDFGASPMYILKFFIFWISFLSLMFTYPNYYRYDRYTSIHHTSLFKTNKNKKWVRNLELFFDWLLHPENRPKKASRKTQNTFKNLKFRKKFKIFMYFFLSLILKICGNIFLLNYLPNECLLGVSTYTGMPQFTYLYMTWWWFS